MAEDGLSVTLPLPMDVPSRVINLLSLPPPGLVIWRLGAGGGPGIWSLRSLGLGFETPVSMVQEVGKTHLRLGLGIAVEERESERERERERERALFAVLVLVLAVLGFHP
jgi:hypothetical protein